MKYDDASWHYGGQFPKGLPIEAGATHIGMYVAWALLSGLSSDFHVTESPDDLAQLSSRLMTPGAFFLRACDGKFTDEDLNDQGNAFTQDYYQSEPSQYISDYALILGTKLPTVYHVPDSWETFDEIKVQLDGRFKAWVRKSNN